MLRFQVTAFWTCPTCKQMVFLQDEHGELNNYGELNNLLKCNKCPFTVFPKDADQTKLTATVQFKVKLLFARSR